MIQDWNCQYNDVKGILQRKRVINFGDVSLNFETVASKLKELEGTFVDGFDNNIKFLLNPKNWNPRNLTKNKPEISLRSRMDEYAFEVHCFPIIKGEPQAVVPPHSPYSPFVGYNPAGFGPLLKINGLGALMNMAANKGDEADFELIKYAHMMTEQLIDLFSHKLHVSEKSGQSIKTRYETLVNALNE